ncbi:I36RA protein, partial [Corythaixoides concolor]|nr:I36RA protein [Corythaixoides concolor]
AELSMGTGDAAEPVIDPDMVALFEEFLGKESSVTTFSEETMSLAQPYHYVVRDTPPKGLCLHDGRLVATSLQVANAAQEGGCPGWGEGYTPTHRCSHPPHLPIEPISVVPNRHLERQRCPLIVGIRGGTLALSCGTGPEPQLELPPSSGGEVGLLDLFSRGAEALPYTFYTPPGGSTHTFESAAFPGRSPPTARGPGEALAVAAPPAPPAFYLRRK